MLIVSSASGEELFDKRPRLNFWDVLLLDANRLEIRNPYAHEFGTVRRMAFSIGRPRLLSSSRLFSHSATILGDATRLASLSFAISLRRFFDTLRDEISLGRAHPLHQRLKASITSHFNKM